MVKKLTSETKRLINTIITSSDTLDEVRLRMTVELGINTNSLYEVSYYVTKYGGNYYKYGDYFGYMTPNSKKMILDVINEIVDESWVKNLLYHAWLCHKTDPHDRLLAQLWLEVHKEWKTN